MYPVSPAFKYMSKIQIISRQTLRPYNNRLPDYCALTREVLCFLISFMRQSKVLQHVVNLLHGLLAITSLQQRVEQNMLLYCQAEWNKIKLNFLRQPDMSIYNITSKQDQLTDWRECCTVDTCPKIVVWHPYLYECPYHICKPFQRWAETTQLIWTYDSASTHVRNVSKSDKIERIYVSISMTLKDKEKEGTHKVVVFPAPLWPRKEVIWLS